MGEIRLAKLVSEVEWSDLARTLDPAGKDVAVKNVLKQLRECGAKSVIVEDEYLDQDFTAAYSGFYSTVFRRYTKICKRFLFFNGDATQLINDTVAQGSAEKLEEFGRSAYLGFIVLRPLSHAPLGRVVIAPPPPPPDMRSESLVYAEHESHVLGALLRVRGLTLTQQDARVGACAQACIWMAGRHFHVRHRGPWYSMVDVTLAASSPTDASISASLPAGSEHLGLAHMARALRSMERRPLFIIADVVDESKTPYTIRWNSQQPQDIISRYIDSGIPVILGLSPTANTATGHAVLVTGRIIKRIDPNGKLHSNPSFASFCEFFLVSDDRRGPNLRMPVHQNSLYSEIPYNVREHVAYIIVPLPNKVFMTGEAAEKISWDMLSKYADDWADHKRQHSQELGSSDKAGDDFVDAFRRGRVVARTYLTYGWKYKARMLRNAVTDNFKSVLYYHELPRFVWITEFGTLNSLNHLDVYSRRIQGHNVVDATGSQFWESRCIFHAPGMSVRYFLDPVNPTGELKDAVAPLKDDRPYYPKVRGETQYTSFTSP